MRGDALTVKERLDIVDILGGYLKLEKAGSNFKARCPFHNEKTASFLISPARQSYYCFGCGKHGDVFTFIQEIEGVDFKTALRQMADKAGVALEYAPKESRSEKDKLFEILEVAALFFEANLTEHPEALAYIESRGITRDTSKRFRLGFAPNEWRLLRAHMKALGFSDADLVRAGLIKRVEESGKEPYDTFRGRIIFPLADAQGRVIAFSGRALEKDAVPKYLNSPDTPLFTKSEVLYGLDKAKDDIRKKNYAVLVEGQMDLVLSHQSGVVNTVASSGTAFTASHLERLKRLSARIILAFDGDEAGQKAAEKSSVLALGLGMEVKVAALPEGKDPADLVREAPDTWKDVLRQSKHAIEFFLAAIMAKESDQRKRGKEIVRRILPLVALLDSSIERSHFVSLIARHSAIREEVLWEDLKKVHVSPRVTLGGEAQSADEESEAPSLRARIEERLQEVRAWKKEVGEKTNEMDMLELEERELELRIEEIGLEEKLSRLTSEIAQAEAVKDEEMVARLSGDILAIHRELQKLEQKRKVL